MITEETRENMRRSALRRWAEERGEEPPPISELPKERRDRRHSEYYKKNKKEIIAKATEWRKNNPEKRRAITKKWNNANGWARYEHHLLVTYGLTPGEYHQMLEDQNNCCAFCSEKFKDVYLAAWDRPVVDHNHTTKKVRALLHNDCNIFLGIVETGRDRILLAEQS
jgi:hypothetical protein